MSSDLFSKQTLMGNWYEERLAPIQPARSQSEYRKIREPEDAISYAAQGGQLKPLPSTKRMHPWITEGIVCNDGFKEFRTQFQTTYDKNNLDNYYKLTNCRNIIKQSGEKLAYCESNPHSIQAHYSNQPNYLTLLKLKQQREAQEKQLAQTEPILQQTQQFSKVFADEQQFETKFYAQTTYNAAFPKIDLSKEELLKQTLQTKNRLNKVQAGQREKDPINSGVKTTSVLVAEKYKNMKDPKDNTAIQHAWIPGKDACLVVVEKNLALNEKVNEEKGLHPRNPLQTYKININQKKTYDIATSLPVGDGVLSLKQKYHNPGEFRHVRQDVTMIKNKIITKK